MGPVSEVAKEASVCSSSSEFPVRDKSKQGVPGRQSTRLNSYMYWLLRVWLLEKLLGISNLRIYPHLLNHKLGEIAVSPG